VYTVSGKAIENVEVTIDSRFKFDDQTDIKIKKASPAAVIPLALQDVVAANDNPQIAKHLDYVCQTWVDSTVWPPSTWSVFRQPVRTNNDVEGWHCRLNVKAHHDRLNMYQLIQLLHTQSELVDVAVRMLSECGTTRLQKRAYSRVHTRLNKLWDDCCDGSRDVNRLLSATARLCKHT